VICQAGQPGDDLLMDLLQLRRQLRHADGLEQIGDDPVLNAGLCVFKIVIPAQKRRLEQRLHSLRLPGERRAGDERHPNIGQQKIRLKLLYQLQGVQPVARPAHQPEPQRLPVDQLAHRLQKLRLVVGHQNRQFLVHAPASFLLM